jgi:predicted metalloprotease with PDZ domain
VRQESQGRDSLQNRYRQLFGVDRGGLADANDVIIKLLNVSPKTDAFTKSYIESKTKIELEKLLPTFGIDVQIGTAKTQLKMRGQLTREQRELWRSLGYKK